MGKLRVLDLFSGLGAFSLGLHRTGAFETVALCEINQKRWPVLRKHFDAPIYADVKQITAETLARDGIRPNVIVGGFPCQELSKAGRAHNVQVGFDGNRSALFFEIIRIARELGDDLRCVILENVTDLLSGPHDDNGRATGQWFGVVLRELAALGFDAEWEVVPAFAVGSIQRRERVVIVAYPSGLGASRPLEGIRACEIGQGWSGRAEDLQSLCDHPFEPGDSWPQPLIRGVDGWPSDWMDRIEACGNAIHPGVAEIAGRIALNTMKEAA
jgi:DNA (cytosine-5)-methyltransferase 1